MTVRPTVETPRRDLRCSTQARDGDTDPAGTAAAADAFLLVEVPLPWPKEITDHPALSGLGAVAGELGARVQGVVPDTGSRHGARRVTLYSRPGPLFDGYERREVVGAEDELVQSCTSLPEAEPLGDGTRDLLVCSHGARDRCCGSLGTALHAIAPARGGLRVSRTSHTGGHRFAPTAVLLPEGTVWGWLTAEALASIVDRTAPVEEVLPHYRGSTAMPAPAVQFAERAVFADVGWSWLDTPRRGRVVASGDDTSEVEISSTLGTWHATVARLGERPQPVCGAEPSMATKLDPVFELVELRLARPEGESRAG